MSKEISLSKLFFPIYFAMMTSLFISIANTYMVSLIDPYLVGAMGAGNQVMMLFGTVFNMLAVGCSVVVSQAIGAKDERLSVGAIHVSISFNFIIGLVCGLFVFFNAFILLKLLQIPDAVFSQSLSYLKILSIALIFDALAIVLVAVIRAYGYANYSMMASIIIAVVTISCNYLVLFEPFGLPNLGLNGVAAANVVGRIIGVFVLLFILIKVIGIHLRIAKFLKIRIYILKKILSIGLPSAGENLIWVFQYMVAFAFVASMGEGSLTVQTIYFQISAFIFFASSAIGISNEVIVARLVGKGDNTAAYKQTFRNLAIGIVITCGFLLVVYIGKFCIMDVLNLDETLQSIMLPLFTLSIFLESARTLNVVMVNALRASGDAKFPFYMGIIFMLGVSIPIGYFLGIVMKIGIIGVWIGFFADEFLRGLANTFRWKSKKWQDKKLV
ncbi:MAG: MATE family efflux transporter [Campylobacter sp.]|nr:MATE family efflux transporter [Campylobacter sp.]